MRHEHSELQLLGKIEAVFSVPGRGTVIVPIWTSELLVRVGNPIQLRASDGKTIDTRINGVDFIKNQTGPSQMAFMLPLDVDKKEIVDGMEIWI
jgi:hypothetical protein